MPSSGVLSELWTIFVKSRFRSSYARYFAVVPTPVRRVVLVARRGRPQGPRSHGPAHAHDEHTHASQTCEGCNARAQSAHSQPSSQRFVDRPGGEQLLIRTSGMHDARRGYLVPTPAHAFRPESPPQPQPSLSRWRHRLFLPPRLPPQRLLYVAAAPSCSLLVCGSAERCASVVQHGLPGRLGISGRRLPPPP